ncbi:MAG: serine/threonine-protein kinase [Acidobacteria bacterium]|nr:serine/threonine-protein kinase [Acidobacteriota bacterium]
MALTPGARFGSYEVVSQLGTGGMGEVYRARDTNLGRQVAIKILPDTFAHDPERLARFEREAKTLAALNHPNIAQIYGFEKADGVRALVMELVEGPTLADRIAQGAIPVDEALPVAKQIAEALEAAHEQGIIHRDLKPANVKVRPDGTVKVLDFGLAKAFEAEPAAAGLSLAPTITSPAATRLGTILGTAAYMSPEQARGKAVDRRADIWAFGCVLYEMLTGRRAFEADDITDVLAAVIRADPPWDALPVSLRGGIRSLLERCLEKDARNRWHDIADVRLEIERIQRNPGEASAAWSRAAEASSRPLRWTIAAFATGAVLAGAVSWSVRPVPAIDTDPVRFFNVLPRVESFASVSHIGNIAIAPDGGRIAYVTNGQVHVRALDQFEGIPIAGTQGAGNPFFSPDGRWIGFHADGKLQRVSLGGGAPLTIASTAAVFGASWGPDDIIVFGGGVGSGLDSCVFLRREARPSR